MVKSQFLDLFPSPGKQTKLLQRILVGAVLAFPIIFAQKSISSFEHFTYLFILFSLGAIIITWVALPLYIQLAGDLKSRTISPLMIATITALGFFSLAIVVIFIPVGNSDFTPSTFLGASAILTLISIAKLAFSNALFLKIFSDSSAVSAFNHNSLLPPRFFNQSLLEQKQDRFLVNIFGLIIFGIALAYFALGLFKPIYWAKFLFALEGVLIIISLKPLFLYPLATLISGLNTGAKQKIWFKNLNLFAKIHRLKFIVLTQSRVITTGKIAVWKIVASNPRNALELALTLSQTSPHPYSRAIRQEARRKGVRSKEVDMINSYPGKGLVGKIEGETYILGNEKLMHDFNVVIGMIQREKIRLESQGFSVVVLARAGGKALGSAQKRHPGEIIALIAFSNPVRPSAPKTINWLSHSGFTTFLITSDNLRTAEAIAKQSRINKKQVLPDIQTAHHPKRIKLLREELKKQLMVVVADERNKAVLENADISVFLNSANKPYPQADITISNRRLINLARMIILSENTLRQSQWVKLTIIIYNIAGILVVASGLLTPIWLAIVALVSNAIMVKGISSDKYFKKLAR